ncbi:Rpp14/Pop5 family protein [Hyperthermus butylicus]|uniref:Ribonuclease P protein component 2 n=1 Tax=Hyperthermus butylicus (strain DSM 5456 / JCM 9403 / PLM1-5) TaxID=415426 RepID=A2BKA5_HYPBU|nr:Rpp14/Pop5 family protein [Hyperthermus butylicus]ABM80416.1 RNase P, Rpp14 family [Hyperthermus butylicus DSM 5456]
MTLWEAILMGIVAVLLVLVYLLNRRVSGLTGALGEFRARLGELEESFNNVLRELGFVSRSLSTALQSIEAEDALERLRRRRRRRYIAFYVVYEGDSPPQAEEVEKAIVRAVERLAGQLTVALARLQLVYYDHVRGAGIVRATNDTKYVVLAAMGLVRSIGGRRVLLVPVRTTGTIKRAKKALAVPRRLL